MKNNLDKKGFVYTLEVLIAVGIIVIAAVVMFKNVPSKAETDIATLKTQGFHALRYMDDTGLLRKYANDDNESLVENDLKALMPSTVNFEAQICGSSCSDANVPDDKDVVSIDYYISGYRTEYMEKRVKLWIWKK